MGLFSRLFGYVWDFFSNAAFTVLEAGLQVGPVTLIAVIGGITLWLGAACWASSIAEARLYSPKVHFFIGLFVPVLYPIILLFTMDVKDLGGSTKSASKEGSGQSNTEQPDTEPPASEYDEEEEEDAAEFDQAYFREIARDDAGNYVGPWRITFGENETVAQRIIDPLPHVVVIETVATGSKGKTQRLRIPYSKIEACVRA